MNNNNNKSPTSTRSTTPVSPISPSYIQFSRSYNKNNNLLINSNCNSNINSKETTPSNLQTSKSCSDISFVNFENIITNKSLQQETNNKKSIYNFKNKVPIIIIPKEKNITKLNNNLDIPKEWEIFSPGQEHKRLNELKNQ
jgi:hypothetical protein